MDKQDIYEFAIALGKKMPEDDIIGVLIKRISELEKKIEDIIEK